MKESKFKWLAANVIDKKTGKPFGDAPPYVVREFDGVKVAIFGLTLEETKITSRPGPDVEFLNPCETARKMVTEIHAQRDKDRSRVDASFNERRQGSCALFRRRRNHRRS